MVFATRGAMERSASEDPADLRAFARRVLAAAALVALVAAFAAVVAIQPYIPLLLFTAILAAILLDGCSRPLQRYAHLPQHWAVGLTALLLCAIVVGAGWIWGPQIVDEAGALVDRVPPALDRIETFLRQQGLGGALPSAQNGGWSADRLRSLLDPAWSALAGVFSTVLSVTTSVLAVLVIALFLALQPRPYVHGLLRLARPARRGHYRELLDALAQALRWWLVGRFSSMAVVGVLSIVGLLVLGVPLAVLLGLLAGALCFIPFLGPVLSAIPAVLVALGQSPQQALWVLLLYGGIQLIESNLLSPLIQQRAVSLPPALLLAAQIVMGGMFGLLGVLVATPFTVAVIVAVQVLYVRGALGDRMPLLGEHGGS